MSVRISTNMAALRATSDFTQVERDYWKAQAKLAENDPLRLTISGDYRDIKQHLTELHNLVDVLLKREGLLKVIGGRLQSLLPFRRA